MYLSPKAALLTLKNWEIRLKKKNSQKAAYGPGENSQKAACETVPS
jgi:hypothetical protein